MRTAVVDKVAWGIDTPWALKFSRMKPLQQVGIQRRAWLATSSWQTNDELTLALHLETSEVAFLCCEFEQVKFCAASFYKKPGQFLIS